MKRDTSRAFGCPQRYIQGVGEIENLFEYGREYGDKFLLLIDGGVFDIVCARIASIENKAGCSYQTKSFSGESCMEAVEELAAYARSSRCNVLAGIGGGKVLDTAKLVADEADVPRIIVPTSASNDAPAADWAAIYTPEGVHICGRKTRRSTELVLVDSEIIAKAPSRLFSAGIGDALATWFEAQACRRSESNNCVGKGYKNTRTAMAVSRECYDILMEEGIAALQSVKKGQVTAEVEDVIEANVLLSGLGFINGGLAGGHGLHSGLSAAPGGEASLHGEKVAFGLLCQLVLEKAGQDYLNGIMEFLYAVDLPITLEQLGIVLSEDNLNIIAEHTIFKNALIHHEPFEVSCESVKTAILTADSMGKAFLEKIEQSMGAKNEA